MVQAHTPKDLSSLKGCTFEVYSQPDPCLARWIESGLGDRGIYSASGGAAVMLYKSYYPGHANNTTTKHDWFTWSVLKAHPRNNAGTVTLRSADPLDPREMVFNYFDTGVGNYRADLQAMYEALELGRRAFKLQVLPISEVLPGTNVTSQENIESYIKDTALGHHATCTCPIGTDYDPMAVLDSKFRVRGIDRLRVVDGSAFPCIPGTFPVPSISMVAEKAAGVILSEISTDQEQ